MIKLNPSYAVAYHDRGVGLRRQGRHRPRDRRFRPGDQARSERCAGVQQPRPRLPQQGRHRSRASPISTRRSSSSRATRSRSTTAATRYYEKRDHDRAIADFDQSIKLQPELRSRLLQPRPGVSATRATTISAIADFSQAIQLEPKNALAYNNRGLALRSQGRCRPRHRGLRPGDQARRQSGDGVPQPRRRRSASRARPTAPSPTSIRRSKLDPKDARAFNNRGFAWRNKGDADRAVQDFEQAIKLDASYALALYNRGNAFYEKKELRPRDRRLRSGDQAQPELLPPPTTTAAWSGTTSATMTAPSRTSIRRSSSIRRMRWPTTTAASRIATRARATARLQDYVQSIKLNPNYALAYYNRGIVYYDKREFDRASQDLNNAIKLNPNYGGGVPRSRHHQLRQARRSTRRCRTAMR